MLPTFLFASAAFALPGRPTVACSPFRGRGSDICSSDSDCCSRRCGYDVDNAFNAWFGAKTCLPPAITDLETSRTEQVDDEGLPNIGGLIGGLCDKIPEKVRDKLPICKKGDGEVDIEGLPNIGGLIGGLCDKIPEEVRDKLPICKKNGDGEGDTDSPKLSCAGINNFCTASAECCTSRCDGAHRCRPVYDLSTPRIEDVDSPKLSCAGINNFCTASQECCTSRCDGAHRCRPVYDLATPRIEDVGPHGLGCIGENGFCTSSAECCSSRCDGAHRCRPVFFSE